ncbi:3558_t:CDS:2, partial [Paraglomus occultum]
MVLLKFTTTDGKVLGSVNWFAVHCTSMYNNNTYISDDNKGYAGYLMEKTFNGPDTLPGTGSVHAFAQSNMGDVSPNTLGAFCEDTGEPCDYQTSTCNGKNELCQGRGPGWLTSDFESTRLIGERQAQKAMELLDSATTPVIGSVDYRHQFINMPEYSFKLNGENVTLCKAAMGYSFAAGTTDGPGAFDFKQGDNLTGNPFWDFVRGAIKKPSAELIECQKPKPVLLATGETTFPYAWGPAIADVQVLKIGNFVILAVPGEFTTMAGRRL